MNEIHRKKKLLLLHICCAPDAIVAFERLSPEYEVTGYFYNPNIHPEEEYRFRLEEIKRLAKQMGFPLKWGEYDVNTWFELTKGMEAIPEGGARCQICFRMRFQNTARLAKSLGFDTFTTVLTVSPHKDAETVNRIGKEVARENEVEFLPTNFKKKDGFKRSVELSKKFDLYRQHYCGCVYSRLKREQQEKALKKAYRSKQCIEDR